MFSKLNLDERTLKNIINITFLTLSSFLIVYFLIQLTSSPIIKVGLAIFAIILEVFMQYLLATGRVRWNHNQRIQACLLFFCYGLYVLIYATPSAIGFFMTEIDAQEQQSGQTQIVESTDKQRLTQINAIIENLNRQLGKESDTGYGARSQSIMAQIDKLTAEQASIQNHFNKGASKEKPAVKDLFQTLGDTFKLPGNLFKISIFAVSVLMLYVGMIMTSWDLSPAGDNETSNTSQETTVTAIRNSSNVTSVSHSCPICGKPLRPKQTYCSNACRQKAARRRHSNYATL